MKLHLRKFKKIISVILAIAFFLSLIPLGEVKAASVASEITILKQVNPDSTVKFILTIKGTNLKDDNIAVYSNSGIFTLPKPTLDTIAQYMLDPNQVDPVTKNKLGDIITGDGSSIMVGSQTVGINLNNLPNVTSIDPVKVYINARLKVDGQNFIAANTTIKIGSTDIAPNLDPTKHTDTHFEIPNVSSLVSAPGSYSIDGKRTTTVTPPSGTPVTLTEQVQFVKRVKVVEDYSGIQDTQLQFTPNTGVSGSGTIKSTTFMIKDIPPSTNSTVLTTDRSIFFVKDVSVTGGYDPAYMSPSTSVVLDQTTNNYIGLNVAVPANIDPGQYYIAVTNKVTTGLTKDQLNEAITSEHIIKNQQFSVVQASTAMSLSSLDTKSGSDTGCDNYLSGKYIGTLNSQSSSQDLFTNSSPTVQVSGNSNDILTFIYNNATYKTNPVIVKKSVHIIVGNSASFKIPASMSDYSLTPSQDKIHFHINPITISEQKSVDVRVDTQTVITKTDGTPVDSWSETDSLPNEFTFQPSIVIPSITSVSPKRGDRNSEMHIAIKGKNFIKYAYTYTDPSTGKQETRYKYPRVSIGQLNVQQSTYSGNSLSDLIIDPDMEVLDATNNVIDGSKNQMYGSTIVLTIPAGATRNIGKLTVKVQNPVINDAPGEYGSVGTLDQAIEIMDDSTSSQKMPIITDVTPNMIGVEGNVDITVTGSQFSQDCILTIDGQEITNKTVDGKGETIKFKAPPYRPTKQGLKLLQVISPNGGIASYYFSYTKTYTDPKITSIAPERGKANTIVTITGQNFLIPDTTASFTEIQRLLGTTVQFNGEDLNDYNYVSNKITFQPYDNGSVFSTTDGKLAINNDYESAVFRSATNAYAAVYRGRDNSVYLKDSTGQQYYLYIGSGNTIIMKDKNNVEKPLTFSGNTITINGNVYTAETPYAISNGRIIGKHVFVRDDTTIEVVVPPSIAGTAMIEGSKDVTVVNPDTKQFTVANGFYYYAQPKTKPAIESITPSQGTQSGGNVVRIVGTEFYDGATVYFGSQKVPDRNVTVGTEDGKSVIYATVPAYPGDILKDKGVSKLTVTVVVVNKDGGSASSRDGYEYLVPISHPQISQVSPTKESAAGGATITILGSDFRDSEPFTDKNGNGILDQNEPYIDINGNGVYDTKANKDANGNYDTLNRMLLPKVYFGGQAATVVDFSSVKVYNNGKASVVDKIDCILPKSYVQGAVDVTVINADGGTAISSRGFTYEQSGPKITSLVPDKGPKTGGTTVTINGSGFVAKNLQVQFGDFTNSNLPISNTNSGNIVGSKASVVIGNLTAAFSIVNQSTANPEGTQQIVLTGSTGGNNYTKTLVVPDEGYMYINLGGKSTTSPDGKTTYTGLGMPGYDYENVKLDISTGRLIVTRGYCSTVNFTSDKLITVITPPVPTVGSYNVYVQNGDGGTATSKYQYMNPSSHPAISNILRSGQSPKSEVLTTGVTALIQDVPSKGNIQLTITGSDFRENATVMIGDKPAKVDSITSGNIVITIPAGDSVLDQLLRVVVTNDDGASANSGDNGTPIYIRYKLSESDLTIDSITPNVGTMKGGTKVTIKGKGFKTGAVVRFGGQAATNVVIVDYKTINCTVPAMNATSNDYTVNLEIENTDFGIAVKENAFTYISAPSIVDVNPKTASIDGGEVITIKGTGFLDGASVYFGPTVEDYKDGSDSKNVIYVNGVKKVLTAGTKATKVEVVDGNTLKVTVPEAPLATKGIIVVNADTGASDIYKNFSFTLAKPQAPTGLKVELVYNKYIRVTWNAVDGVDYYEVYRIVNGQYNLVDNVKTPSYIERNLLPNTLYEYTVRAVKDSVPSDYSEVKGVTTPSSVDTTEPEGNPLNESSIQLGGGGQVIITIGIQNPIDSADLTDPKYASAKKIVVNMPAYFINHSRRVFTLVVEGGSISIPSTAFKVRELQNLTSDDEPYSVGRVKLDLQDDDIIKRRIPNGNILVSKMFTIDGEIQIGKKITKLEQFTDAIKISMAYDESGAIKVRGAKYEVKAYYYDYDKEEWVPLTSTGGDSGYKEMSSDSTGTFIIMLERKR